MGKFNKISSTAFKNVQTNAGMLLYKFDPENPTSPNDKDIITCTSGGINISCTAEYSDFGEDIDNVPNNTKEMKQQTGWTCTMTTTALEVSPEVVRFALGAADIDEENSKIVPRRNLENTDFSDIWWVGETLSKDGWIAVQLMNALSTGGFSLQTTKDGKGTVSLTITGHVSISDLDTMPVVFYFSQSSDISTQSLTNTTQNKVSSTSKISQTTDTKSLK